MVKASSTNDDELLKLFAEIGNCSEICTKYKQPSLKPIAGFSLSKEFKDTVSVDLKEISSTKFLHIIGNATHFSTAAVACSKRKEEIVDTFSKHWIARFGAPDVILSDNGGDFNNSLFFNVAEQFNITLKTTAAELPWSNSMVERHNGILAKTIAKLILDSNKYSIDVVITWAVNAKNSLHNCYDYSPNQLVFGNNPSLPSFFINDLPAIEESAIDLLRKHLNAMSESRKAFLECEANQVTLSNSFIGSTCEQFNISTRSCFIKQNNENMWKGPGIVIGKENKQILVKHG